MTINQNKEDLEKAIELLKESLEAVEKLGEFQDGWEYLVVNIKEFLNQIEENVELPKD